MGDLTLTAFLTVDGVTQAPGGPAEDTSGGFRYGGWVAPHFEEDAGRFVDENFRKVDAFLLGRVTYDIFAGYWPKVTDPGDLIASQLNSLPKYIASHTRTQFDWNNSRHIADVIREVPLLKQRYSGEIQVHGSGNLAQTLMEHDLIDEYRLMIFPAVIGSGKRLFGQGTVPGALKLVSSTATRSGVVMSVYRRAGELVTGTVGT
ncbi:MAG: dihydrofolate reductase family protein [Anaerolineaceae bacterium]